VLAGGNSLGAYEAGAYAAFHAAGLRLERLAGSSIGAVNAAIIAGNPPERRAMLASMLQHHPHRALLNLR
jgi:NTE family protein